MMRRIVPLLLLLPLLAACSQTSEPPAAPPLRVVALAPANGATAVALDAVVAVEFDALVDTEELSAGTVRVWSDGGPIDGTLAHGEVTRVLRFVPDGPLAPATRYTVEIAEDVRSVGGIGLQGIRDWSFTTVGSEDGDPVDPDDDAAQGPGDPGGTPGGPAGGSDDGGATGDAGGAGGGPVDPGPSGSDADGDGLLDVDDPDPTNPNTDGDALPDGVDPDPEDPDVDRDGVPDGEKVDVDVPGVLSVQPVPWSRADSATDVRVRFDEPIDPSTLDAATVRVYEGFLAGLAQVFLLGGEGVEGDLRYDGAGRAAVFTPARDLKVGAWHWVVLRLDVADAAGNRLRGEAVWLFLAGR